MTTTRMRDAADAAAAKGTLSVAVASVIFGSIGILVHALRDLPFPALLAYRYGFGALAFIAAFLLVPAWRNALRPRRRYLPHLVGLGAALVTIELLFFTAILRVGMGLATILLATAPIYVALGEWKLLGDRPDARGWIGIALGFAGVVLIVGPDAWRGLDVGVLAGVGSGIAWSVWLLVSRAAGTSGATGEAQAAGGLVVAALLTVPVGFALAPVVPGPTDLGIAALLGAGAGGFSILFFTRGLRSVTAARAAVIAYLEPLTAVALGTVFLAERFGLWQAAGSALVIAGTALVTVRPRAAHA